MRRFALSLALLCLFENVLLSQPSESPQAKAARMAWWKEAKFGLFLHWGLYAVAAGEYKGQKNYGEWLMYEAKIPIPEYEQFAQQFNPTQFNADYWVAMAKNAGMKYIVITSKHHDGFCLFDSKVSDYDLLDRTPFKRDPLRELADACRKHGLKLCFYYSIMDWHHPQANNAEFARYRDNYMLPQLKELLTQYGDIGVLWFDGEWIEAWTEEQGKALYQYVRNLQPNIIVNNRVGKGRKGMQGMSNSETAAGDFGTPEQEILGEKSNLDWESCMTMNDHWGYNKHDKSFKSAENLIWNLVDAVAKGGNYLLNVGPTAEGLFPPECVARLQSIGTWMNVNKSAIYGVKPWTHWQEGNNMRYAEAKNGDVYLFFKQQLGKELTLKKINLRVGSHVQLLGYADDLMWRPTPEGIAIELPPADQMPFPGQNDMPRVLRLRGQPAVLSTPPRIGDASNNKQKKAVFVGSTEVTISAEPGALIRYTTDGSEPTYRSKLYSKPLTLSEPTTVKAISQALRKRGSEVVEMRYEKARYGLALDIPHSEKYAADGPLTLVDGIRGSTTFTDGKWLGYEGTDMIATLDLGSLHTLTALHASFLRVIPSWIFLPKKIEVLGSSDGADFALLAQKTLPLAGEQDGNAVEVMDLPLAGQYRFLKIKAQGQGVCPPWHAGAGGKAWVFADEIWVDATPAPVAAHKQTPTGPNYDLLPTPVQLERKQGYFPISAKTVFYESKAYESFFRKHLFEKHNLRTKVGAPGKSDLHLIYAWDHSGKISDEGYALEITARRIKVTAHTVKGFFYADQTLIQLLELNAGEGSQLRVPCAIIRDAPRFSWRGMHLDESRHFFGKAFVKRYLDHMAALKLNVFHWHLTDAPGWRLEIKKYPKLTSVGAWRPERKGQLFADADTAKAGEPMTYGGFYTQAEVREILAYAQARNIVVIPEIEMPGHCTAALVAYPEYSCTGGPFPMPGGAKNSPYPNFCVGNDKTMAFLQDILSEVIALFPAQYIHIGGDEVERDQWKRCPRCQKRMATLGFSDESQLQVDFTKRIESFIRSKGRRLMGWDEIMEGDGLPASAGVMVWRGEEWIQDAVADGHETVVTHQYYFDLYQGNPQYEPVAYGYKPIEEVYQYEPVPEDLLPAQKRLIKGVQGCLWSENLYSTRDVEYMLFPRLFALAETAWTPARRKSWKDFSQRLPTYLALLSKQGTHYATSAYNPYPQLRYDSTTKALRCHLEQQIRYGEVRYTTNGLAPTSNSPIYTVPLDLRSPASIRAAAFLDGAMVSKTTALEFAPSLTTGKPFVLKSPPAPQYNGNRPETLTDGIWGTAAFHDGNWCGFYGADVDMTIDLERIQPLQSIRLNWLDVNLSWIYLPLQCTISISEDGQRFETVRTFSEADLTALDPGRLKPVSIQLQGKKARYVRIYAKNRGDHPVYPEGECWLFLDEVEVR